MSKFIILDTETTGVGEDDRIIQLGYIVLEGSSVEVYHDFCSTKTPISVEAMEVHHITPKALQNKPTCPESKVYKKLCELNTKENYMIIHNAPFDIAMLNKEGFVLNMQLIDTLRCAKHLFVDEKAYRLQYFRYKMKLYEKEADEAKKLNIKIQAHDAIGDVVILKLFLSELKKEIQKQYGDTHVIDKMVKLTQEPVYIKTFKFGKYKNRNLSDIAKEDAKYLKWMLTSMSNIDEDLKFSINHVLMPIKQA